MAANRRQFEMCIFRRLTAVRTYRCFAARFRFAPPLIYLGSPDAFGIPVPCTTRRKWVGW